MTDAPQAKPDGHRKTPLLKPVSPVLERIATAHRDRRIKPAIHPTPTFWTIPNKTIAWVHWGIFTQCYST